MTVNSFRHLSRFAAAGGVALLCAESVPADTHLDPPVIRTPGYDRIRRAMGEGPDVAYPPDSGFPVPQAAPAPEALKVLRRSTTTRIIHEVPLWIEPKYDFETKHWTSGGYTKSAGVEFRVPGLLADGDRIDILTNGAVVALAAEAAAGFPGEVIDEVIVPVPSEIFLVLDKLGKPDWRSELRNDRPPVFSNRIDMALLLGSTVAEGFVAVQAQDQAAVERIGKDVLKLAESLGLKDTVLPHTNSILEASKNGHWEIVRVELDKTQKTVRDTMERRRDKELAQCVSLGGWLRGTEAVTDLIAKHYTSDSAELLNQPDIVKHFQKALASMAGKNAKLQGLLDGLKEIAGVIGTGDEAPAAAGIQSIHTTAARLVKSISSNTKPAGK